MAGRVPTGRWALVTAQRNGARLASSASAGHLGRKKDDDPGPGPAAIGLALRNRHAGHDTLVWARPDMQAPENFTLTSPAFDHGTPIPERYRGRLFRGQHLSCPRLDPAARRDRGTGAHRARPRRPPRQTRYPRGRGEASTHRSAAFLRTAPTHPSPVPGIRHGKGPLGHRGGPAPKPPRSHGQHSYVFQLFALDSRLDLPDKFILADTLGAMAGHVVARARLDGTYEIR